MGNIDDPTTVKYNLNGLKASTLYRVELRAYNEIGYSAPAEILVRTAKNPSGSKAEVRAIGVVLPAQPLLPTTHLYHSSLCYCSHSLCKKILSIHLSIYLSIPSCILISLIPLFSFLFFFFPISIKFIGNSCVHCQLLYTAIQT